MFYVVLVQFGTLYNISGTREEIRFPLIQKHETSRSRSQCHRAKKAFHLSMSAETARDSLSQTTDQSLLYKMLMLHGMRYGSVGTSTAEQNRYYLAEGDANASRGRVEIEIERSIMIYDYDIMSEE